MALVTDIPTDQVPGLNRRRHSIDKPPTMSADDQSLRIVMFGITGRHQFSLTEAILQKKVFDVAANTVLTTKTSGSILGRNVTVVNTPNLKDHDLLHYTLKKELKKAVCFSCPGPHVIILIIDPFDIRSNAYDIFKPLVQYFGESVLNHTMTVLYHEEEASPTLEDSVKKNRHFTELIEKCDRRCLVFSGKGTKMENNAIMSLFEMLDTMVNDHGIFSNIEFKDADKRIKKEEKTLERTNQKEVRRMLEALEKEHSGEDLEREVKLYKDKVRLENRDKAELLIAEKLGFTLRVVDYMAAIGKGAAAGAALGFAMGFPGTVGAGAAIGAALGVLLGGAAGAAWSFIARAFSDV